MFRIHHKLLISLIIILITPCALALKSDKDEKVIIVADSGVYNYKTGIDIYEGHVKVDQGTSHIRADKLITKKNDQHKIKEAIAYGINNRAYYWTLPNAQEPEVHAKAKIIKFYPIESNVTLEQNVFVKQGDNSFKGQLIHYNKNDQIITVPATENARAVIVYNPDKNDVNKKNVQTPTQIGSIKTLAANSSPLKTTLQASR